ncbi:MAG: CDP-glycerol glycerophosphotransferase family protein [bacterium]
MFKILFELTQEYYLPSFMPIYKEMNRDPEFDISFRVGPNQKKCFGVFLIKQKKKIEKRLKNQGLKITDNYKVFDAVICGTTLKNPQKYGNAILCNVDHGPGLKTLRYREFLKQKSIKYHIFVEGQYRIDKFKKYGLEKIEQIYDVGLPKLDPFFQADYNPDEILKKYDLDPKKKTVLYAPSYKPTSIFEITKSIHTIINDYNVIVKLHPYSWNGKYAPHQQHRIFEKLAKKYENLILIPKNEHNMMPFLYHADTMISDGSSVINEFLALGKCGIIFDLDYSKLKHSDGQPLLEDDTKEWLKKSFVHIDDANQLKIAVKQALNPSLQRKEALKKDRDYIFSYTDGNAGKRVKNIIKKILKRKG